MYRVAKVFKRGSKRVREALGREVSSDSDDSDYDGQLSPYDSDEDEEAHVISQLPSRARSPTRMKSAHMEKRRILKERRKRARQEEAQAAQEQASLQRQAAVFTHDLEINEMIENINRALGLETSVDLFDPRIRFVIGQIVNARGLTEESLSLMRRNRILLRAIGDIAADIAASTGRIALRASDVVYNAGQAVLEAAGRLALAVASRLPSLQTALDYFPISFSSRPIAPGQPDNFQVQGRPDLGFPQVLFQSPPPPPASAPAVEEDDCSICMTPLINNVVSTTCKHKFHRACVTPWLNSHKTCPMCRKVNPTPLDDVHAKHQGQGGGSRKTRSRSKTRRLRKSRNKPRKSRKSRKPRSSSRRK